MTIDPRAFRLTMGLFATGVTIITIRADDNVHAMTANAITSVSLEPLLVLFCVNNRARMARVITKTGRFAIHCSSKRKRFLANLAAGR